MDILDVISKPGGIVHLALKEDPCHLISVHKTPFSFWHDHWKSPTSLTRTKYQGQISSEALGHCPVYPRRVAVRRAYVKDLSPSSRKRMRVLVSVFRATILLASVVRILGLELLLVSLTSTLGKAPRVRTARQKSHTT